MLYSTLSQPLVFFVVFLSGIAGGIIFDILKTLAFLSGNDKYSKILFDFLATVFAFAILYIVNLNVNYGQFRVYVVSTFLLSIYIERVLSKFLWTKCVKKWYNRVKEKKNGKKKKVE